jgi:hypothetical protein
MFPWIPRPQPGPLRFVRGLGWAAWYLVFHAALFVCFLWFLHLFNMWWTT